MGLELLTMGRISADLYPEQVGVRARGGDDVPAACSAAVPTNVAVAARGSVTGPA